ncbi:hypothetical protein BX600DRAFT_103255 [Xylariales sp. PMI_506]|nr:hypothetical protein BX600DRAFT_103255 [Xylariales sp. PMI_506]
MTRLFNVVIFDTMAELCFGEPLGMLDKNKLSSWVQSIFGTLKVQSIAAIITYYPLLDSLFKRFEPKWVT